MICFVQNGYLSKQFHNLNLDCLDNLKKKLYFVMVTMSRLNHDFQSEINDPC